MTIYKIYDNGGKTLDRYTLLINDEPEMNALCLSDSPTHPTHGFSQFTTAYEGDHLGKEIKFKDLPENVQKHALSRLKDQS